MRDGAGLAIVLQASGFDLNTAIEVVRALAPAARSVNDFGFGLAVPVRAGPTEPVTAIVLAGTLPVDGVQRIDSSLGNDLRVTLAAQHGGAELIYFHGEAPPERARTQAISGSFSGIEWVAKVAATPAFEARLDTSGADITGAVVFGFAIVGAVVIILRLRLAVRAEAAAARAAEAERRAGSDPLTGLLNRAGLDRSIAALSAGPERPAAVVFVDLDGLKAVNDNLGHEAGDLLIGEAARRLQALARTGDLIARQGGDEFVVVTPGVGSGDDGWHTTERILEAFADPVPGLETAPISGIAASIGVALATTHRIPDAIARADAAMYAAKQAGGNRALLDGHPIPPPEPTRTAVDRGAR